jgi:hypothetical protein
MGRKPYNIWGESPIIYGLVQKVGGISQYSVYTAFSLNVNPYIIGFLTGKVIWRK